MADLRIHREHDLGLEKARGARGVRAMLTRLRCIQLDPLDVIGTNADLVALARVDELRRGWMETES